MPYITFNEYCAIVGIDPLTISPLEQTRIEFMLEYARSYTDMLIGDIIELKQRKQRFSCCDLVESCQTVSLLFCAINMVSIDEIDGQAYTGVVGTDYYVDTPNNRRIVFKNLPFGSRTFGNMEITFTSGFATVPSDIQYLQALIVQSETAKQNGIGIKSYKLRDRTVQFADADGKDSLFHQVSMIANKYFIYCTI